MKKTIYRLQVAGIASVLLGFGYFVLQVQRSAVPLEFKIVSLLMFGLCLVVGKAAVQQLKEERD